MNMVDDDFFAKESELQAKLNGLHDFEATLWKQKSRIKWLTDGDSKTKFFHRCLQMKKAK